MRVKVGVAAATAALFLTAAGVAQAQQSSPPASSPGTSTAPSSTMGSATKLDRSTLHEIKEDNAMAAGLAVNAKDLRSMAIYGSDGKKIGEVKNVLGDTSNQIKAVTADVGGFLGIGAREVVFPIDKLQKGSERDRLQTAMTKDEIEDLEAWASNGSAPATGPATGSSPATRSPGGSGTGSTVR